ncbi:hypothetical protein HOLleu_10779 [Holothuria leucospilota]|uniref:Uncharacterized protein n=1 Tax=Holothuria leucospilota TaxID=206669 RepID=A0A9Q1HF38_HOLLE|nr:hypothetical protein HOLleu_10779 [Holothuria leucospilota]
MVKPNRRYFEGAWEFLNRPPKVSGSPYIAVMVMLSTPYAREGSCGPHLSLH